MSQFESARVDAQEGNENIHSAEASRSTQGFELDHIGEGVKVESLDPGTILDVRTRNSCYRLTLLDGDGHALVTGGSLFPQPTEVHIEGSTAGGSALKLGWITVGLRLELSIGNRLVTTSDVQSVEPIAA